MVICSPSCGCRPDSGSGGEKYEDRILRGLAQAGEDPHVLLADKHRFHPDLLGHVEGFRARVPLRWWVMPFVMPARIGACWAYHGFDVLRVHSPLYLGPAVLIARRRYGITRPLVVHVHHWEPRVAWLERWVVRRADLVIADSLFVRQQLVAQGVEPGRVKVVSCGVDPAPKAELCAWPAWLGKDPGPIVLSIGPCIPRKDPLLVVRAVARAWLQGTLVWLGEGPLRARAQREARRLGVRALFPGFVSEADKRALLTLARGFVFASRLEGCPLAVLEAMAAGLPVVALRAASLPELVGASTGVLVDTEGEMARALIDLLARPDRARVMGHAGRAAMAEMTWAKAVTTLRQALAGACQAPLDAAAPDRRRSP